MYRFEHTSEDFTYHARRTAEASKREIYVYVIGEASRAANWQLYGYHRETNPCLTRTEGLVVFRNTVTQSNTTHKSVPLILSSVKPINTKNYTVARGFRHSSRRLVSKPGFFPTSAPREP